MGGIFKSKILIIVLSVVLMILIAGTVYSYVDKKQNPENILFPSISFLISPEKLSPYDRIKEEQIHVYDDKIIIDIKDAEWATFSDTNSMDPLIDMGANAIEIIPKTEADIHVGDVVSYESEYADGIIIHRVIEIGKDEQGTYFVMKGDNNPMQDPGRIRFNQIKRVLVAVIY